MKQENQLAIIAKESNLPEERVKSLVGVFGKEFKPADQMIQEARTIKVTDESQIEDMQKARRLRIDLGRVRVNIEKTRKGLKEQSLREGKAIDGMSNVLKALIIPVEEHLEQQEKFAEIKEQKRVDERHSKRTEELSRYVEDVSVFSLRDMSEEAYVTLLTGAKKAYEDQIAAEKKAEQERIKREKEDEAEQKRIRKENETLKKEREEREKELEKERESEEKKRRSIEDKLKKEREKKEALEAKIEEARLEKEDTLKRKEEERLRALQAPDKEKLIELASTIANIPTPSVASKNARIIVTGAEELLRKTSAYILQNTNNL